MAENHVPPADQPASPNNDKKEYLVSWPKAKHYKLEKSAHITDANRHIKPFPLSASSMELGKLGVGVMLYFETLKFLGIIFFICFLISIPSLLMMVGAAPSSLVKTNSIVEGLEVLTYATLFDNETIDATHGCMGSRCNVCFSSVKKCASFDADTMSVVLSGLDVIYTILFLLALAIFRRVQNSRATRAEEIETTAADFTVIVHGLPTDVDNPEEVLAFFSRPESKVVAVVLACADGNIIRRYREIRATTRAKERLEARNEQNRKHNRTKQVDKLQKEIDKFSEKIKKMEASVDKVKKNKGSRTTAAFVTFEFKSVADRWIREFSRRPLCGFPKEKKFRHKHTLKIQRAPEPSDIQWENLSVGSFSHLLRKGFALVASFFILLAAVVIVVAAKNFKQDQTDAANQCTTLQSLCYLPLPTGITSAQYTNVINEVNALPSNSSSVCVGCVCNALLTANPTLFSQSVQIGFAGWSAQYGAGGFCTGAAKNIAIFYALQILSVIIVVGINFFAKYFMIALARFERHHLLSHQEASTAISIFAIQFFNMGLIILVVFGDIERIRQAVAAAAKDAASTSGYGVVNQATQLFPIFSGPFDDITYGWYAVVGTSLMLTILVNVIIPIVPLLLVPFKNCMVRRKAKSMVLQDDMNEALLGPPFAIAERYG